ncbi:Hypothetical predicted protein [Pelobates cultripes]|uniref:Sushi domain-containing protein n=1 Tax=Pelobates cultripes TaxID=61616 RepID=A0AAD1WGV3_PELCU|nr:Hypothetical predicted protein [Pelobates cultripes]
MSDVPEPAVSAELKAWLFNAITESIPKALAAFREQTIPAPTATITQLSDSEDSHASEHEEAPRKRPWKGDSATAGKGKAPAKHPKVPYSKPRALEGEHISIENSKNQTDIGIKNVMTVRLGQTCIRPEIADGQLYYYYYFPKQLGTYIDYRCSDGFLPQDKRYYGRSYCTENGWNPKPKCTKTCSRYNAQVENGYLQNSDDYYLVGEKVQFSCKQSYLTKDKQKNGERECLPNGKFTEDQCSKFCDVTQLPVGKYAPDKKIFVVGETLLFECNNGFVISSGKTTTNIQCLQTGWSTFPRCIEYKCVVEGTNLISQRRDYKIGEVAQISCPPDYTLKGSELIQCYNNGWGPELPKCEQEIKCNLPRIQESNLVKKPNKLNFKVNEEVSLSCHKNLFLNGANLTRCTSDGWVPTLPVCQKDIPKPHEDDEQPEKVCTIPSINNLIRSPHYPSYVVGKEVQFSCQDNFQRIGQRTSICTQDGWKPDLPTCQARNPEPTQASTESATQAENPEPTQPSTESARQEKRQKCPPAHSPINAEIKNPKAEYYSGDTVEIECSPKYILNGDRIILCKDGKWQSSPQCIPLQKCPKPPIIKDGEITEETRKSEYFTDDIVKYSCNPGFHITGSDESRCTERTWLAAPQCTEDPCSPPPSVTNANVVNKKKLYKHGEYAEYVCVNNYKIAEEKPATCLEGKWWHVPTCVYISCSPPPEIENGVLTGYKKNQYASGEKVRYRCNNGYAFEKKTNEKSEAICEETQWKSLPVCRSRCLQ